MTEPALPPFPPPMLAGLPGHRRVPVAHRGEVTTRWMEDPLIPQRKAVKPDQTGRAA